MRRPSDSARLTSPGCDFSRRTRTASSADDATCAWTPQRRRTTPATGTLPTGSSSCRSIRHASACRQLIFSAVPRAYRGERSEEHTSELQSRQYLVCRLLLEKKKHTNNLQFAIQL